MRLVATAIVLVLVTGCCGGGSGSSEPAALREVSNAIDAGVGDLGGLLAGLFDLQFLLTDPDSIDGIEFRPDPSGPPNQFLFSLDYDSDDDGDDDGTLSGTILVPTTPGDTGTLDLEGLDDGGEGSGMIMFRAGSGGLEVWGTGSTTDTQLGFVADITVEMTDPVVIRNAPGGDDGNFCEFDVQGPVQVDVRGTFGFYELIMHFLFGQLSIDLTDRVYREQGGMDEMLSNSSTPLTGCREVTIDDWVGSWSLSWFCVPPESGTSTVTFTKTGPNTLQGNDDGIIYTATADPGNPGVLRGFFIDTDDGGTYREDFVFTLAPNGQSWSQDNDYTYSSGPAQGSSGECFGTATKLSP